jgi:hypothetical protein
LVVASCGVVAGSPSGHTLKQLAGLDAVVGTINPLHEELVNDPQRYERVYHRLGLQGSFDVMWMSSRGEDRTYCPHRTEVS